MLPAPKPNQAMVFLQAKRAIPTWGLILGLLLACALGRAFGGGTADASNGGQTVTQQVSATTTPRPTSPPPTATPKPTLQTIVSFQGTGEKNTANFHIAADQWQLAWSCQPGSFGGNFMVEVDHADGSIADYAAVNEICDSSKHDVTIERGGGDYYLKVTADVNWQIAVQAIQ